MRVFPVCLSMPRRNSLRSVPYDRFRLGIEIKDENGDYAFVHETAQTDFIGQRLSIKSSTGTTTVTKSAKA